MRKTIIILLAVFSSLSMFSQEENKDITTYYLIRHAEKKTNDGEDPGINAVGIERAKKWVETLKSVKFDRVFTTNFKRTKQTAKFIADANELPMLAYKVNDMYNDGFKFGTKGKTVLLVGHSNTIPMFVNKVLGKEKYPEMKEDNFGNLYIVIVVNGKATSTLLHVE